MDAITSLLIVTNAYCAASGLSESTVSTRLFSDGKRLAAIRAGSDVGARRLARAMEWLSANWPPGADWPEGVPRVVAGTSELCRFASASSEVSP